MIFIFLFLIICSFLLASPVMAQCPVCIITVGGGMILAEKLGIDDFLVSIWISALNTAIAFWLAPKIKLRFLKNPIVLSFVFLFLTLFYFQYTNQIGSLDNRIFGLDKIILGQSAGLLIMFLANFTDRFIRQKNKGKVLFYYQKVIVPVGFLVVLTLLFKFLFKL